MSKSKNWTTDNIPNQKDRIVIITGGASGIGKETAQVLAAKGASVILAVRDLKKSEHALSDIKARTPDADVTIRHLDLADLSSIKTFSEGILADYDRLDVLVNNAGIMFCPYAQTKDGFEIQMGTNHLGHFALTGYLLPLIEKTKGARIVAVSSIAHMSGNIDLSDINWSQRPYKTTQAYSDSKIANLYFVSELKRRLEERKVDIKVMAAHPGWTRTHLQRHSGLMGILNHFFSQDATMGALPTLRAGFDDIAENGDYYGPSKFFEMHGVPVRVKLRGKAGDQTLARRLWDASEKLTGVNYG